MDSGPPERRRLRLVLFLATCLTTLISGSWFWAGNLDLWYAGRIGFGTLFHPAVLADGLAYALPLMAILTAHEFGHYLACRYYRVTASLPYFLPVPLGIVGTFGAVIRIRQPITAKGPIPLKKLPFEIAPRPERQIA